MAAPKNEVERFHVVPIEYLGGRTEYMIRDRVVAGMGMAGEWVQINERGRSDEFTIAPLAKAQRVCDQLNGWVRFAQEVASNE